MSNQQVVMKGCAWCLSEQELPMGEGSHGICKAHANRLLLQWRERHRRRILNVGKASSDEK